MFSCRCNDGEARVTVKDGKLYVRFNDAAQGELEHWERETFRISWNNPLYVEAVDKTPLTFQIDGGKVTEMKAQNLADYRCVSAASGK